MSPGVIELWTGIPAEKVSEDVAKKMANLERELKARIIGQDEAVDAVVAAIRRSKVRLDAKKRPASFIFVGPDRCRQDRTVQGCWHRSCSITRSTR